MQPNGKASEYPGKRPDEYQRNIQQLQRVATIILQDLYQDGHPELTKPFAQILTLLSDVDFTAVKALDTERLPDGE